MEDEVGLRVCDWEGHRGTIRYVGSVANTKGTWYGIDWDDEARGKHDGSHNEEKYFWTWSKTSGSFMRKEKLKFGMSFMEAVHDKYVKDDNELLVRENVEELKNSINAPFLELVGFEQVHEEQKSFENLKIVSLMDTRLSNAGAQHNEILLSIPNIEELDMSKTLLASWFSVGEITCQLKYLRSLNLSNNKLPVPNDMKGVMKQLFPLGHIHTLTLGNMDYTWDDIVKLLADFPVTCLKIPHNNITTLQSVPNMFLSLEELNLQENNIADWSEVNELGTLPKLKHLNLSSTRLRNIKLEKGAGLFPSLETLYISHNLIESWDNISLLHYIPTLHTLRFTNNPILSSSHPERSRDKTIARLANLKLLNGSTIEPYERKGAEYDYIKEFGTLWLAQESEKKRDFIDANPRYAELVQLHGPPLLEEVDPVRTKKIITLNFENKDKTISKKIPRTLTIAKLVNLLQRLFRNSASVTMYYTSENNEQKIEIDVESLQEVGFFNLQEGDTIHVTFNE